MGYYRIAAEEPLALNESDQTLASTHFSGEHNVILRGRLADSGPASATFFFHKNGRLESEFTLLEFPLDASRLSSPEWTAPGGPATRPKPPSLPAPALAPPAAATGQETATAKTGGPSVGRRAAVVPGLIFGLLLLGGILIARFGAPPREWLPNSYTQPLLAILSTLGVAGLIRRKPALGWAAVLGFLLVSWSPVEWLLSRPLEAPYPPQRFQAPPEVQAIVVLSSAVEEAVPERPFPLPDRGTFSRCEFAAWIHRTWPRLPVLASGGGGQTPPLSDYMRELLIRAGVPDSMIWTEGRSRNTHESAVYSAELLREHGIREIALVIDARSMFRAAASFRKQGMEVVPAPSAFRKWDGFSEELLPGWRSIARNETTLHEVGGILWYRLHGWI